MLRNLKKCVFENEHIYERTLTKIRRIPEDLIIRIALRSATSNNDKTREVKCQLDNINTTKLMYIYFPRNVDMHF